jgi:hypothetical protein
MQSLLTAPLKYLPRYLLPRTIEEAEDYLSRRLETATLFFVCDRHLPLIFERRFPGEWVADQEKILPPDADTSYSQGELKCLELIAEHLFPFAYEHLEMVAHDEGERLCVIPLYSFGIDLWNYGLGELSPGWKMLALLNRDIAPQNGIVPRCALTALKEARPYTREAWSWDVFRATCADCEEPLSSLPVALQMLDHDTGNLFLDPSDDAPVEDATWTLSDIELLAQHWKEAQDLRMKADQLADWLAEDPRRFRKVVDLWNLSTWKMLLG